MAINYKKLPRKLIASTALIALLGVKGADNYINMVAEEEGYVPEGYHDPVGIPTKCFGEIDNVVIGKKYTFEECERGLNKHAVELIKPITKCIKHWDSLPDKSRIALASMTYNIGSSAMCKSSIVQYANAKNFKRMCTRMSEIYIKARGVVLKGLIKRRKRESDLCLEGIKEWELQNKMTIRVK